MTNIAKLIEKITQIEGAEIDIGRGPKHLSNPNLELLQVTESYLRTFPFLKQDPSYVDFMEQYSGFCIYRENPYLAINGLGFANVLEEVAGEFLAFGESSIVEDGFLTFCDADISHVGITFAYDVTGQKRWGIYRTKEIIEDAPIEWYWYCETFSQWLEIMIGSKGLVPQSF